MNCSIDKIIFSKPKKHGEYLICKVKYDDSESNQLVVQLPKMKVVDNFIQSEEVEVPKNVSLEFINNKSKYNKEVYDFLSKLDDYIINFIHKNSLEWFSKEIPLDFLSKMYNKFIKAPKDSESQCTMNFSLKKTKEKLDCVLMDNKKNELELSDFKKDSLVECITQLKYIIFSKDTCFTIWELCNIKLYKKIKRVPKFGFIEDSTEVNNQDSTSDFEVEEDYSFF
jgi:hypothetical protein